MINQWLPSPSLPLFLFPDIQSQTIQQNDLELGMFLILTFVAMPICSFKTGPQINVPIIVCVANSIVNVFVWPEQWLVT